MEQVDEFRAKLEELLEDYQNRLGMRTLTYILLQVSTEYYFKTFVEHELKEGI